jgi:hypothetical protein
VQITAAKKVVDQVDVVADTKIVRQNEQKLVLATLAAEVLKKFIEDV